MSEEIKQDRSPRSATLTLEDAIILAKKLHDNAGRSTISRASAFKAMGYGGTSGASLSALATLTQYGLVDKVGSDIAVSALTVNILHPTDEGNGGALRLASLTPPLFKSIFETHHKLSEPILVNHLVQQGFALDRAKKVASVYKANVIFAKLDENGSLENKEPIFDPILDAAAILRAKNQVPNPAPPMNATLQALANLNELSVPVGEGRFAKIPFPMTEDDFDLFTKTIELWKKKIVPPKTPDCI